MSTLDELRFELTCLVMRARGEDNSPEAAVRAAATVAAFAAAVREATLNEERDARCWSDERAGSDQHRR